MITKAYFNYKKLGDYLALAIIFVFLTQTFFRLYPFTEITPGISNGIDDWFRYWNNAKDITHVGFWMPSQSEVYYGPGSFLYNYFIAGCFLLFGERVAPIYFIQSLLLALSILFIYYTFRRQLSGLTSILFLLTLFAFALLDVYKYYTFKLLSENLGIFTLSVFVYFAKIAFDKTKMGFHFIAIFFLLLSVLTRPTLFPLIFAYILFLFFYFYENPKFKKVNLFGMLAILLVGMSGLAFRNYYVVGVWEFLPSEGISDSWKQLLSLDFSIIYKKILFSLGFLPQLNSDYNLRPHWFILALLYSFYLFHRLRNIKTITYSEFLFNGFIIGFYVLTILFVTVDSYGFRAFLPIQFLLIAISFLTFDKVLRLFLKEDIL